MVLIKIFILLLNILKKLFEKMIHIQDIYILQFYFCIEIDQNIEESIRIIEPAACERFGPAILFLYFIYLYGYKSSIDIQKASYYRDLLYKNYYYELLIKSLMAITCNKNDIDMIFKQRIFDFFKH